MPIYKVYASQAQGKIKRPGGGRRFTEAALSSFPFDVSMDRKGAKPLSWLGRAGVLLCFGTLQERGFLKGLEVTALQFRMHGKGDKENGTRQ